MDKTSIIFKIIPITISIIVIIVGTNNIWNTPDLDVQVNPNPEKTIPVDVIVRKIHNETNYMNLTADFIRDRDLDSLRSLKYIYSENDAWVIDRIYHLNTTDGLSQKIVISNLGQEQAHNVIIQILGVDTFKIVDYLCPEIISPEQIIKENGKKYLITQSRLSVQLPCTITINSVGETGIAEVIVTADDSTPAYYPKDLIKYYTDLTILFIVIGYAAIILTLYLAFNLALNIYKKKSGNPIIPPKTTIDEIQDMIDADFGNNVSRLFRIRDELQKTSRLNKEDIEFLQKTTREWDDRNR